ncbi:hypothetical protein B2J73_09675 [Stutzerimonas stutzeri]|nr:hypothetical protein B2J73_09675 [Stutzerimonas stutzeri]
MASAFAALRSACPVWFIFCHLSSGIIFSGTPLSHRRDSAGMPFSLQRRLDRSNADFAHEKKLKRIV